MGKTAARLESFLARSYPGFRVADQAPLEDVPRQYGQRDEGGAIRGFGPALEFDAMFSFDPSVSGMNIS